MEQRDLWKKLLMSVRMRSKSFCFQYNRTVDSKILLFFFIRINEASLKYFGRSLADCEHGVERLEDSAATFSDIGSDIGEVGKQLSELQVR